MRALGAPLPVAVGVSGGSDSLALMLLLRDWAKRNRAAAPVVLTVDHGLHARSSADARRVVRWANKAGLKAHVLAWKGAKPAGDIEAAAREARYRLMGQWCRTHGIARLCVAHTRDDQAETFLLRLARGSGLDGLSAMRPLAPYPLAEFRELSLSRPLLGLDRSALRAWLAERGQEWLEDPMNADPRFDRVRVRSIWATLEAAGLGKPRIAAAASHLARAREALETVTAAVLARACRVEGEAILVEAAALSAAPREIGLRGLAELLRSVSGQAYRPRFDRLERLFDALAENRLGGGVTLHGCRIAPAPKRHAHFGPGTILIRRETPRSPRKGEDTGPRGSEPEL